MGTWRRSVLALGLVCWVCTGVAQAAPKKKKPTNLKTKVTALTVFKDGTSLFEREGRLGGSGWYVTTPPPAAILGSLWFHTKTGAGLARVKLRQGYKAKRVGCRSQRGLLQANAGKQVTLLLKDKQEITGKLLPISRARPITRTSTPTPPPMFVSLQTTKGVAIVPFAQIKRTLFAKAPNGICSQRKKQALLWLKGNRSMSFRYSYLQKGLQWTPLYQVTLGKKTAKVRMQAVLTNHQESVEKTTLRLVVGVPNVVNRNFPSPLSTQPATVTRRSHNRYRRQRFGNYVSQRFSNAHSRRVGRTSVPGRHTTNAKYQGSAKDLGNLFVYKIKGKVSLVKGARLLVPVMQAVLPYKRFYRWQPGPVRARVARHRQRYNRYRHKQQIKDRVWEYIALSNTSAGPLTTGPAAIVDKGSFAAQDVLRYTPPGGRVEIPVTVAANILSGQVRTELSRAPSKKRWRNRWYARVTYKVSLTLVNFSKRPTRIKIRKRVSGQVVMATKAKFRVDGSGGALNPTSEVSYEISIPPKGRWNASFKFMKYMY